MAIAARRNKRASTDFARPSGMAGGSGSGRILGYIGLVLITLLFAIPIIWMAISAFKTTEESTSADPVWLPSFTTEPFSRILDNPETPALRWFFNSIFAASVQTVLTVLTASLAAYALARMNFRFKNLIFTMIISTLFIPGVILTIPLFIVVDQLNWVDTLWAVAVPGSAAAFGVFFLRQFFSSLPRELEEAAFVDGANRWNIFTRVILPLSKPALVTLALITFLANWNDFLWPVYALLNADTQTLPPGLATLQNANATDYAVLMAGAMIASVPVLLLFVFTQRYVIEGVSRSGLKG